MSDKESRELDAWIAKHVMGRDDVEWNGQISWDVDKHIPPNYTTNPAAAMLVLEKCADKKTVAVNQDKDGNWCVAFIKPAVLGACCVDEAVEAATLPLAICRFARQLFSQRPWPPLPEIKPITTVLKTL